MFWLCGLCDVEGEMLLVFGVYFVLMGEDSEIFDCIGVFVELYIE